MVLTRAFACATPVVASDIGGYREVIEPGTAVLVPPANPARWPTRSSTCSRTRRGAPAIGAAARELALERYSWDRIAARLEEIYEQVAA